MNHVTSDSESKKSVTPLQVYNVDTYIGNSSTAAVKCCCPSCPNSNDLLCQGVVIVPCTKRHHAFHVGCARNMLLESKGLNVQCPGCFRMDQASDGLVTHMHFTTAEQKQQTMQLAESQRELTKQLTASMNTALTALGSQFMTQLVQVQNYGQPADTRGCSQKHGA